MGFLDRLEKKLKEVDSKSLSTQSPLVTEKIWVSTGCPELDYNLHTFGFKKGIIEIAGGSTAGKTTMGLTVAKNFLIKYEDAILIMMLSEERINGDYVKRIGVDPKRIVKVTSKFLEDLFYKVQDRIYKIEASWQEEKLSGRPKIVLLWDSINATNSRAELETYHENVKNFNKGEEGDKAFKMKHAKMADFASAAKRLIKAIHAQLYDKDIIMICLNHLTADLANPMGGKTSTGGSWREFFSYIRLQMQVDKLATSKLKIDGEKWCQITDIKVIKNDFGGYNLTKMKICIGHGIMLNDGDIDFAVEQKILTKKESTYSFLGGKLIWKSPRTLLNLYRENNKLLVLLHNKVIAARHKQVLEENNIEQDEE